MPFFSVPFTNNPQEKTFWCWAAVASNVYNSFNPPVPKSQCDVVTLLEGDCRQNQPEALSSALSNLGIRDELSTRPRVEVVENEFEGVGEQLQAEVAEPVCAEILFRGRAAHFVVITAIDTDSEHVWIADPFLGGNSVEFSWDDFVNHYHYAELPDRTGTVRVFQRVTNIFAAPG